MIRFAAYVNPDGKPIAFSGKAGEGGTVRFDVAGNHVEALFGLLALRGKGLIVTVTELTPQEIARWAEDKASTPGS